MNTIKRLYIHICLALLGIGIVFLGAWDMQRVTAAPVPEAWSHGTNMLIPNAFYGSAQCPDDSDSFYVVAGWQAWFVNRDDVLRFDTEGWHSLAEYPEAMGMPSVTCYHGYLYGAGGNLGNDTSNHFYRYEIASDAWTQLPDLPRKQNGAALVAWDGYLYMIGGDDAPGVPISPTTQVDRYNLHTGLWEMNWGTPMPAEIIGDWLQMGRYIFFVGGYTAAFPINSDATFRYDLVTDSWEIGPSFDSRRTMMTLVITNQYLYAIGGDTNGGGSADETNLVESLDLSAWPSSNWVNIGDPLPAARMASYGFCRIVGTSGEIWSVGGLDIDDNPTVDVYNRPSEPCAAWPPEVVALSPETNSHEAPVTTPISITYDQDMDPTTVFPQTFAVHARQTGWLTETLSVEGGMIKLQPVDALHAGELVQVSATTATLSLDGEAPLAPTVWEFTTAPRGGNRYFHENQVLPNANGRFATLGDIDQDGDLDAIGVSCLGFTRVYQNQGNASFIEIQSFPQTDDCLLDVDLGDLDGDGDLDAFLTDYDVAMNFILTNDGTGHFSALAAFPSHNDGYTGLGDLDGDGDLDLFIASGGFNPGELRVWMNDGSANFSLADTFDTGYEHTGLALGDLDNDGDLDAFTTGWYDTYNKVWLNDGSGSFSEAQVMPDANTYYPLLGDLDGDGDLDAYLSNAIFEADYPDEVWLNDGYGQFTNTSQALETVEAAIPALGDLDADGDLDVYASGGWDTHQPDEVWANDGTGMFNLFRRVDENHTGGMVTLGDLEGDGNLDAFVTSQFEQDGYQIYLNGDWMRADPLPEPRATNIVQCVDMPDSFFTVGGVLPGNVTSDQLIRYNISLPGHWQNLAPLPAPRRAAALACYDGRIFVAGGMDENYWIWETLFIYDIANNTWTTGPNMPQWVWGAAMGAWDGKLYVVGGNQNGDPYYTPVNTVDVFDLETWDWIADGGENMPTAASFFSSVQTGPYLYAVGGMSGDFAQNVNQTQRYNMAADHWDVGPLFTSARGLGTLAASSTHLYMLGGDLDGGTEYDETDMVEMLDLSNWPDGDWEGFNDPLPAINIYPAAACSETMSAGEIWSIGGGINEGDLWFYDANLYHPITEPCVQNILNLSDTPIVGEGEIGHPITYTVSITNTGNITDYYELKLISIWPAELVSGEPGPVAPGATIQVIIEVQVPLDVHVGDQGITMLTVNSLRDPNIMDGIQITTTVVGNDIHLEPDALDQAGMYGETITYTLLLANQGTLTDTVSFTHTATAWDVILPVTDLELGIGESAEVVVNVTIPLDAGLGDLDDFDLIATSTGNPLITDSATLTTTAFWYRVFLPLGLRE